MRRKWVNNRCFSKRFAIEIFHHSGGKLGDQNLINDFVSVAQQKSDSGYFRGVTVLVILGSNDKGSPESLGRNMEEFVKRLLLIQKTKVIVSTIIPRRHDSKKGESKVIESVVQQLQSSYDNVFILKLGKILNKNIGWMQGGSIWLWDGVHLCEQAVSLIVDEIFKCFFKFVSYS